MGLLQAMLDAIQGSDEKIGGQKLTRLTAILSDTEVAVMNVETTYGFGQYVDGEPAGRVLVGGEIIAFEERTPTSFVTLTRGVNASRVRQHVATSLVYDLSQNSSAIDHVRRGFLVSFAVGEDLDIIARNLGLPKCPGLADATWREIIKVTAYLAKQPLDAFRRVLDALLGAGGYTIREVITEPWKVFVAIAIVLADDLRGRFVLNGGQLATTNGAGTQVTVPYQILAVHGVYVATFPVRRGERLGITNHFLPGGSFLNNVITLGTVTPPNEKVIVDYTAHRANYLAPNETVLDDQDYYAYLADPLLTARCLLDHVRAAGIKVEVSALLS